VSERTKIVRNVCKLSFPTSREEEKDTVINIPMFHRDQHPIGTLGCHRFHSERELIYSDTALLRLSGFPICEIKRPISI